MRGRRTASFTFAPLLACACGTGSSLREPRDCSVPDLDGDGFDAEECGGTDCDDDDTLVRPDGSELEDWTDETVDPEPELQPQSTAIVIDTQGTPRVSYNIRSTERPARALRYAVRDHGAWRVETVSSEPPATSGEQGLALDPDGEPHVVYTIVTMDGGYPVVQARYASMASGAWSSEALVAGPSDARNTALAIDDAGTAHVFYLAGELGHESNATGEWQTETLASAGGAPGTRGLSVALDGRGAAHIAYLDSNGVPELTRNTRAMYATNESGKWRTEEIAPFARECLLALSSDGSPHILFADDADSESYLDVETGPFVVRLASLEGGSWSIEDLAEGDLALGWFIIDDGDTYHVGYSDAVVARSGAGGWRSDPLEPPPGRLVIGSRLAAVAFEDENVLHLALRSLPDERDNDCDGLEW